jgi:hypothetical protein
VAQHVEAGGVLGGDDRERRIALDAMRGVDDIAVDGSGQRGLGEAGPIAAATSATETGAANSLTAPSGNVILGMAGSRNKKVRASRTFPDTNDVRSRVL